MIRRRIAAVAAALVAAVAIEGTVEAGSLELDYQAVMHVRESHSIAVLDDSAHSVGVAEFRGLAIFPDHGVAVHRYEGWFDLTEGAGRFHGYALWQFEDGAELRASYAGVAEAASHGGITFRAEVAGITGKGRFEAASGNGRFGGRRIDALEEGGGTYLTGTLSLTLPD